MSIYLLIPYGMPKENKLGNHIFIRRITRIYFQLSGDKGVRGTVQVACTLCQLNIYAHLIKCSIWTHRFIGL